MAFADDYVGVHDRMDKFLAKYPDGRIQTAIAHLTESLVVMKATVYRDADDPKPSIAHSQLGIPGKSNFTRDSEVENAETSAVGRALAFMGFETKKGIASREEVRSRQRDYAAEAKNLSESMGDLPEFPTPVPVQKAGTVPEWYEPFKAQKREYGITNEQVEVVLGKPLTVRNIEAWMAANEPKGWANLLSQAADRGGVLTAVR